MSRKVINIMVDSKWMQVTGFILEICLPLDCAWSGERLESLTRLCFDATCKVDSLILTQISRSLHGSLV